MDSLFFKSFKLQQMSDTKIGLNISSGIDSNLMIGYLNKLNNGKIYLQIVIFMQIKSLITEMS